MDWEVWAYFIFTVTLVVVFVGIIIHYYRPGRKKRVEEPKYRMLDDDKS